MEERAHRRRIWAENAAIFFLGAFALFLFCVSFFPSLAAARRVQASLEMGRMVERAFSVALFFLATRLYRRLRAAHTAAMAVFVLHLLRGLTARPMPLWTMAVDVILLVLFFLWRRDFRYPSGRTERKKTALFALLAVAAVLANVGLTYHQLRLSAAPGEHIALGDSFALGLGMIFGLGDRSAVPGGMGTLLFWFSWCCILAALALALRPWMQGQAVQARQRQHARTLLNLYSQNPCSYLALEDDKQLYFGKTVDGVVPYGTVGDTVVVNGDPVCADGDFSALLAEFTDFCRSTAHQMIFLGLTDHFIEEYRRQGFGTVKSGEEARFHLADYEISGKKGAKMRMNINHAKKAGVTVAEYRPLSARDPDLERELDRVTQEWLGQKKSDLLRFTMGTVGLDDPMDKRYFYAKNDQGKVVAFIVFVPFLGKNGYMADVTRHGNDAPGGVMETIIYEAFQAFKAEGVEYGSLGVAPLAGLDRESRNPVERLLDFVYDHLNDCYGFRDLFRAKEKYSPTEWVPSYYAYLPKLPGPSMLYAVVEIQNPKGIRGYVKSMVTGEARRIAAALAREKEKRP